MVKPESVTWDSKNIMLNFTMTDMNEHEIQVSYKGSPPDLFKEGQGVVAEGTLENEGKSLKATRLMVKHSEEYKAPKDAHNSVNKELLEKSLFK